MVAADEVPPRGIAQLAGKFRRPDDVRDLSDVALLARLP